jgi:hypothetical protein
MIFFKSFPNSFLIRQKYQNGLKNDPFKSWNCLYKWGQIDCQYKMSRMAFHYFVKALPDLFAYRFSWVNLLKLKTISIWLKLWKKWQTYRIKNVFFHGNEQKRKIAFALNEEDFIGIKQNK